MLCLFGQFCFGQMLRGKPVHGQVVNDSIPVEGGSVFNMNSKVKTFINSEGFFDILAKAKDTLFISTISFKSRRIVIKEEDVMAPLLVLKLETVANRLKEVIVPKAIKPNLGNIQRIIDKPYFDDAQSSPKNRIMPNDGSIENGMDFKKIGKMIGKLLFKEGPKIKETNFYENFSEAACKSAPSNFFTHTLKLKKDQVGLFLIFCENDSKAKTFLKSENKFELIDFLITKRKEFKD